MAYWNSKKELKIFSDFGVDVMALWKIEDQVDQNSLDHILRPDQRQTAIQKEASQNPEYQIIRARVAGLMAKAVLIGHRNHIPTEFTSYPPAAVGGPVINTNLFEIILNDNTWGGVSRQMIVDAMNRTLTACHERVDKELWQLFNPFHWISVLLGIILRSPFWLISKTGFNVSKIEDHFIGKISKLFFIFVILWFCIKLGFTKEQLKDILIRLKP